MISEEKEIEFVNSNYDDIKKVKSIWICMDSESESIIKYNLTPKVVLGDAEILDYDSLMEGIIVRIRNTDNHEKSKNNLIEMLEELFGNDNPETKKRKLEEQGMVISKKVEGRLNTMCNYSELVMERGIERGENRLTILINKLTKDGLSNEILTIINDEQKKEEYYKKYNL